MKPIFICLTENGKRRFFNIEHIRTFRPSTTDPTKSDLTTGREIYTVDQDTKKIQDLLTTAGVWVL